MKVKKVFGTETTDYLDGFQYTDSVLKFFPTAEGYFNVETGKYVYNYTDHLGNIRLSYAKNGAGTEIIEESNYYPFGLKHEGYNVLTGNLAYKYKYNGKELQETGMYDYGARMYMPDLGRWGVMDNKSEKYISASPYHYAGNNPVLYFDIDGNEFTDDAWEWVNKLISSARNKRAYNNYEISKYQEMIHNGGSEKEMENWQKKIDKYNASNNDLDNVIGEINVMASSNQVYDVIESNNLNDSSSKVGAFGFNFNNGKAYIILPNGSDLAMFSHELKHGYQFETGESGSLTKDENEKGTTFLHDKTDEVAGYQRGKIFGQNDSYTTGNLPNIYDGLPTGPINATNHPEISQALKLPANQQKAALQNIANKGRAFRANGQTYYKK